MAINVQNFQPCLNYTVSATASNTDTVIGQPVAVTGMNGELTGYRDIRIKNASAVVAFVRWGMTNAAAASVGGISSFPVLAGESVILHMGMPATHIGVILASDTGTVYLSVGNGS